VAAKQQADVLVDATMPLFLSCWRSVLLLLLVHVQVHMLSMSAVAVLFWGKKSRPAGTMLLLRLLVLLHAMAPAVIR
jgi:hypothetical protein